MNTTRHITTTLTVLAALTASAAATPPGEASTATVYGLTQRGNRILSFQAGTPGSIESLLAVTGLASDETLFALDFRPSTGELLALSNKSILYRIDLTSGAASALGAAFAPGLAGTSLGLDFNPVPDRIRVVSESDENLRLNPNNGTLAGVDTPLAFAAGDPNAAADPNVVAAAYTSSFAGATSTTLYGIDSNLDVLVRQGSPGGVPVSPNSGQLFTIGALGIDVAEVTGFDVSAYGGALAAISRSEASRSVLVQVNLATGAATMLGVIGGAPLRDIAIAPPAAPRIFGLTADDRLVSFRPGTPGTLLGDAPVTGLASGETLLGMDFRPATGELVALGSTSRLYRVDPLTAAATPINAAPFATPLAGTDFGVDFNPVPDRVRVVSDAEQNLRLNPNNGAIGGVDTALAYASGDENLGADPNVVAAAYTDNFAGTSSTTLYAIDSNLDRLVRQGSVGGAPVSPNAGQLFTVGALGVDTSGACGFDVTPFGGSFASLSAPGAASSSLYVVNLGSGAATLVGAIGGGVLRDIAVEPPVTPRIYALAGSGTLVSFAPGTPGTLASTVAIGGLQPGETLLALDFRPATGALLGLGSTSRLYRVDPLSGAATQIGAGTFSTPLAGTQFGADFNPVVDRVRVIGDAEQNLRLHPATGAVAGVDTPLAFAAGDASFGSNPNAVACAYTSSFSGTTSTTLFALDSGVDALVRQGSQGGTPVSPNSGQLFTVGALGIDAGELAGFDITALGGAFASLTPQAGGPTQLFQVNLATGAATLIGSIGGTEPIRGIAAR